MEEFEFYKNQYEIVVYDQSDSKDLKVFYPRAINEKSIIHSNKE